MLSQVTVTAYPVPAARRRLAAPDGLARTTGALDRMTGSPLGQTAVLIALGLYTIGFFLIRRLGKIDV